MSNVTLYIILACIIIALVAMYGMTLWKMFITWHTPLTGISTMPSSGWVEVTGRVRGDTKTSLLKKSPCAFWQTEVQEWRSSGRGGGYWKTTLVKSSGPFEVDDGTGRIQIADSKTSFVLNQETRIDHPEGEERMTLELLGIKFSGFLGFTKKIRAIERVLNLDEKVLVVGKAVPKQSLNVLAGTSITPRLISNLDKRQLFSRMFIRKTQGLIIPLIILLIWGLILVSMLLQAK